MISNDIIKAALLGTDKYMPPVPAALAGTGGKIMAQPTDAEDRFLKLAITTLLYEEAGQKATTVEGAIAACPAEVLPTVGEKIAGSIKYCLSMCDDVLLHYLVYLTGSGQQVTPGELAPALLNKALEQKTIAGKIVGICGEAGKWLCSLNPNWQKLVTSEPEGDVWETGSFESRCAYLSTVRRTEPARAVAMLEAVVEQENAANRATFTELLAVNLSLDDEPFLQKLLLDKGQRVKETAMGLLQKLQGSAINKRYLDYLLQIINIKEERYMLISKRKVLTIREDLVPGDDIFQTGISKVSSEKGVPDHIHFIGQLIRFVDPAILATQLGVADGELLSLLLQHKDAEHLLDSLAVAAGRFGNRTWAIELLVNKGVRLLLLMDALHESERMNYYGLFVESHTQAILHYLLRDDYPLLPAALGKQLLAHFAKSPYGHTQTLYRRLALQLPDELVPDLKAYAEGDAKDAPTQFFKSQAGQMLSMIETRNNCVAAMKTVQ